MHETTARRSVPNWRARFGGKKSAIESKVHSFKSGLPAHERMSTPLPGRRQSAMYHAYVGIVPKLYLFYLIHRQNLAIPDIAIDTTLTTP
jgi:hypothetical protein